MPPSTPKKEIWTIGHSNHPLPELLELLFSFRIEKLVDVRRFPGSRKYPYFNKENLEFSLPENKIEYIHMEELGGRRKVQPNSKNEAWRLASFQGYANYMETETFQNSAAKLQELALNSRIAYMCSEAVWWSCHRSLISDYLKIRSWKVHHIMGINKEMEHPYTKPAQILNGRLSYSKTENSGDQ